MNGFADRLWSGADFEDHSLNASLPNWARTEYRRFRKSISSRRFPCYFAPRAQILSTFINSPDQFDDLKRIENALVNYLENIERIENEMQKALCVLAIFIKPQPVATDLTQYEAQLWRILNFLHDNDPSPWPDAVSTNPEDATWSFCFKGVALFVNGNSPAHSNRLSRNLGDCFVLVIQPRSGIDYVAPPDEKGDPVRSSIRSRIPQYDRIAASPEFTTYGSPGNRDWKLYFLSDDNGPKMGKCPFGYTAKSSRTELPPNGILYSTRGPKGD